MAIKKFSGDLDLGLTLACWLLVLKISATQISWFMLLLFLMGLHLAFMLQSKAKLITTLWWGLSFIWWLPLLWFHLWQTLLAQVSFPILWLNFLFKWRYYLLPVGCLSYLLGAYLMLRLGYVLGNLKDAKLTLKATCQFSLRQTKACFPKKLAGILILTAMVHALSWRLGLALMFELPKQFTFGLVCLNALVVIFSSAYALRCMFLMNGGNSLPKSKFRVVQWLGLLGCLLLFLGQLKSDETPHLLQVLAHRGVNQTNGVPNTLPALSKIKQQVKVDYAEIDLQITKDRQFVVSHDDNLAKLTGKQLKISQTTLKKLQAYSLNQGKNKAHLASFDAYLKLATGLNQRLLVELKPEANWNQQNIQLFLRKYQTRLLKNHALLHTADYQLLKKVKAKQLRVPIGYIEPFTIFKLNAPKADFYSLNANLLSNKLASQTKKPIFVWTVNRLTPTLSMAKLPIAGVITDDSLYVKQWLKRTDFPWLLALKEF